MFVTLTWTFLVLVSYGQAGNSSICSPVNATATGNCFKDNIANWEIWCGEPACMNESKWLSSEGGNFNGTCGQ
jgi:hypothetical protein